MDNREPSEIVESIKQKLEKGKENDHIAFYKFMTLTLEDLIPHLSRFGMEVLEGRLETTTKD